MWSCKFSPTQVTLEVSCRSVFVLLEAARPHLRAHVVHGDGVEFSGAWRCCGPPRCVAVVLLKLPLHQRDTGGILRVDFRTSRGLTGEPNA